MLRLDEIKQAALAVGFDDCGVARADALTDEEYPLREWLRRGWHGDLEYMERNADKRMDPRLLVPGAKSVICCVSAYPPPDDILPASGGNPGNPGNRFDKISQDLNDPNESWKSNNNLHDFQDFAKREKVAAYAKYRDYHKDIKQMLFALRERLGIEGKCCCDTVPISDKHWAARAGLGWIGRHTLLVTPRWGSWVNLGEIVTTEEIKHNSSLITHHSSFCSTCGRCVDACPNHAIAPDGPPMLNVTRCTAYYTTHHQREFPPDIDTHGYTMGCDLCQLACPFNRIKP
jgi:epoxyqueuosine reductase